MWEPSSACFHPPPAPVAGGPEAAAAAAAGGRQQAQQPAEPPYDGPIEPISKDDYFTKNAEFAAWLKDSKGVFFRHAPGPAAAELPPCCGGSARGHERARGSPCRLRQPFLVLFCPSLPPSLPHACMPGAKGH